MEWSLPDRAIVYTIPDSVTAIRCDYHISYRVKWLSSNLRSVSYRIALAWCKWYPYPIEKSRRDDRYPVYSVNGAINCIYWLFFLATTPDTVGFGLNDSPAGLASYVLEKFVRGFRGTRCQNQDVLKCMEDRATLDELLTNIMIYWETRSMPSAARIYKEAMNSANRALQR